MKGKIGILASALIVTWATTLSGCEEYDDTEPTAGSGPTGNTKQIGDTSNSALGGAKRSAEQTVADVERRSREVAAEADRALDPDGRREADTETDPEAEPEPD